jgi:homoserine O-succinyltransferase
MPVIADVVSSDHHLFTVGGAEAVRTPEDRELSTKLITIGLINNMPDSALISTERQLFTLLDSATSGILVRLCFYALAIPRSEWAKQYINNNYCDLGSLRSGRIDGLIVTGAEPLADRLEGESYWDSLCEVVEWAKENTISAIWSCLAVHGAVRHMDGIDRERLAAKCFGVFDQRMIASHQLVSEMPPHWRCPHSRWNAVSEKSLVSAGYNIVARSDKAGADIFVKNQNKSLFVFFQGHPEYETQSLLGEYRRDVGRFIRGEVDTYPRMPEGYFDRSDERLLLDLERDARTQPLRGAQLFSRFPTDRLSANLKNTWQSSSTQLFRNWIAYIEGQKDQRRRSAGR